MTAFIVIASVLAYLAAWVVAARWWYARIRPFSEPVNCRHYLVCEGFGHDSLCYSRTDRSLVNSRGEAATWASLVGLAGPLLILAVPAWRLIRAVICGRQHDLPAEVAAKTKRLERENTELRARLEGRRD